MDDRNAGVGSAVPLVNDPGSIADLASAIGRGTVSIADVLGQCLRRIDAVEPQVHGWCVVDRECALAQADVLGAARRGRHAARPAAWHADRRQGRDRRRGPAHPGRQRDARADAAGDDRCIGRHAAARGRRHRARQGAHHRVRLFRRAAADAQSVERGAYAGRVERRTGGGGRGRHGAAQPRHPDRRVGQPARGLLRHRGVQAEHARVVELRRGAVFAKLRYGRRVRLSGRRCGRRRARAHAAVSARSAAHSSPGRRSGRLYRAIRSFRRERRGRANRSRPPPRNYGTPTSTSKTQHHHRRSGDIIGWHKTMIEYEVARAHRTLDRRARRDAGLREAVHRGQRSRRRPTTMPGALSTPRRAILGGDC